MAYEPAVFGLCRRLVRGDDEEAEDLTQEAFIRAYCCLDRLKDRERFGPWLYQIARSLVRDRRRRRETEKRALRVWADELRREDAPRQTTCYEKNSLTPMLDDLPETERRILTLRYFDGLTYNELSERMNLSFSQVDHLIRKARSRLARRARVTMQR